MADNNTPQGESIKGILLGLVLVLVGQMLAQIFADNFYWDGLKLRRKKDLAPKISDTRVITM